MRLRELHNALFRLEILPFLTSYFFSKIKKKIEKKLFFPDIVLDQKAFTDYIFIKTVTVIFIDENLDQHLKSDSQS